MDEKIRVNRKGQLMIWVIVAIVIVIVIILFFFLRKTITPGFKENIIEDPRSFIHNCVKTNVEEVVDIMLPQGGFVNPKHIKLYKDINISYLCYNAGNYRPCINEHPLFLNEMKNEIKAYIEPRIEQCFQNYKSEMGKRNTRIDLGPMKLDIDFAPNKIYVNIDREVDINKNDESFNLNEFKIEIINPIYNLGRVAMEIASQEAEYCYFEHVGYMILYPKFRISVFSMSDSTKIYTVLDKKSRKEINIAIRSCAIPPGL